MQCSNNGLQNCLCICDNKDCDSDAVCVDNPEEFMIERKILVISVSPPITHIEKTIKIKNPPITLELDYLNKRISKI